MYKLGLSDEKKWCPKHGLPPTKGACMKSEGDVINIFISGA